MKYATLSLVAVAVAAQVARAESLETDSLTAGWMLEHAKFAALVEVPDGDGQAPFGGEFDVRVVESLKPGMAEETVRLRVRGVPVVLGARYLVFAHPAQDGALEPVHRTHALRRVETDDGFVAYARAYGRTLGADGKVADPAALRELLVSSLASGESGVPFCAGRDLVRHAELLTDLEDVQRERVTAALGISRKPDQDLASVILAAGVAGNGGAPSRLIALLVDPATRHMRRHLTLSLARLGSAQVVAELAARLDGATVEQRTDLANALGALERADAEPALTALLRDADEGVVVEAAHGLGKLARAVRRPGEVGVDGERPRLASALEPLRAAAQNVRTENGRRATIWAVAQIDTAASWEQLRHFRDRHEDARVRALAERYLDEPRVALVLR